MKLFIILTLFVTLGRIYADPAGYSCYVDTCVSGNNIPGMTHHKTRQQCADLCDANSACLSFEHSHGNAGSTRSTNDCSLQRSANHGGDGNCNWRYNLDLCVKIATCATYSCPAGTTLKADAANTQCPVGSLAGVGVCDDSTCCEEYDDNPPGYSCYVDTCVSGSNIPGMTHHKTRQQCADLCDANPDCLSFEHSHGNAGSTRSTNDCSLQNSDNHGGEGNCPQNYNLDLCLKHVNCVCGQWSSCSATCGEGTQTRACSAPVHGGDDCVGPTTEICNLGDCPVPVAYVCDGDCSYQTWRDAVDVRIHHDCADIAPGLSYDHCLGENTPTCGPTDATGEWQNGNCQGTDAILIEGNGCIAQIAAGGPQNLVDNFGVPSETGNPIGVYDTTFGEGFHSIWKLFENDANLGDRVHSIKLGCAPGTGAPVHCDTHSCAAGRTLKEDASNTQCPDNIFNGVCDDNTCCEVTCDTHSCAAGTTFILKENAATTQCTDFVCDDSTCCDEETIRTCDGQVCVFPFSYDGVVYNHCTTMHNEGTPWCGTEADFVNDGTWGNCDIDGSSCSGTSVGSESFTATQMNSWMLTLSPILLLVFLLAYQTCASNKRGDHYNELLAVEEI